MPLNLTHGDPGFPIQPLARGPGLRETHGGHPRLLCAATQSRTMQWPCFVNTMYESIPSLRTGNTVARIWIADYSKTIASIEPLFCSRLMIDNDASGEGVNDTKQPKRVLICRNRYRKLAEIYDHLYNLWNASLADTWAPATVFRSSPNYIG
jgi:hypothetical protein